MLGLFPVARIAILKILPAAIIMKYVETIKMRIVAIISTSDGICTGMRRAINVGVSIGMYVRIFTHGAFGCCITGITSAIGKIRNITR